MRKNATITELIEQIKHIEQLFKQYDAITVPTWYMGGDVVHRLVSTICGISEEEVAVLAQPQIETHASQMEEALLQGALSGADVASVAHMLAEAYYWMPFGYEGPQLWNQDYFETQLNIHRTEIGKAKVAYDEIQTRRVARLREQQLILKRVTAPLPQMTALHRSWVV